MIVNIQIDLLFGLYAEEDWTGIIEIDSSSTLEELHYAIQDAVKFENDHMYEFFISRTEQSGDKIQFDDENGKIYSLTIDDVFPLPKGKKLFYLFDYGDSWIFKVKKNKNKPHDPVNEIKYPRLVNHIGKKPEQYPIFDDDFA